MDLPLGSLGDPNVLPVDLVMDTVKCLPCQPDTGLSLPNLFKKSQEQQSSKLLQEVRRKQERTTFPLALLEQVLARIKAGSCTKGRCENVPAPT